MLPGGFESDRSADYSASDEQPVSEGLEAEESNDYSGPSSEGNRVPAELGNQQKSENLKKYWHKVLAPVSKGKHSFSYVPPKETTSEVGSEKYWREMRRRDPVWRRGRMLCAVFFFIMLGIGAALWHYRDVGEKIAESYEPPLAVAMPGKLICRSGELLQGANVPLNAQVSSRDSDTGVMRLRNGGNIRFDAKTSAKIIFLKEYDGNMQAAVSLESGNIYISSLPASLVRCDSLIVTAEPSGTEDTAYAFSISRDAKGKSFASTEVVKGEVTVCNTRGNLSRVTVRAGEKLKSYAGNIGEPLPSVPNAWVFWNSTWSDTAAVAWPAYRPAEPAEKAGEPAAEKKAAPDAKAQEANGTKKDTADKVKAKS